MEEKIVVLENDVLRVEIAKMGAELKRIYGKQYDIEYLWEGKSPLYWQRSATLLFPFVGRLQDGKYTYKGKSYSIQCHGFAKDMVFTIKHSNSNEVSFILESTPDTLVQYPFDFSLEVVYSLERNKLYQKVVVTNPNAEEMLFKIGFHPGFNVPFDKGCFEDYKIVFDNASTIKRREISERGLETGVDYIPIEVVGNKINLTHDIFIKDALVLSGTGGKARLCCDSSSHFIALEYNAPWCGIWQTARDDTPFVAIEPWFNLPGRDGVLTEISNIEDIQRLSIGKSKCFDLVFSFN